MNPGASSEARRLEAGGRIAGKLELRRAVGEGGMGAVWVARNITTGGSVAVKVLRPEKHGDGHAAARFRYEAKLGAALSHRNITRVFDLLEDDDGSLVLVMELLKGETLRDYYKRKGSLSTREAVAIAVPLLSALQHAHDHGVVHRDLKPTNIFLHTDPDGQVTPKLLDFGIAKAEESSIQTRTGDALGTPQYMSPEQVRAIALDGRSDLFSLAIVLYEIITGTNPYPGPTSTAVLAQVLELEIDPDPAIDMRVWLELKRALSKQPYQRHASAKELANALCAAVGESEDSLVRSLRAEPPIEPVAAEPSFPLLEPPGSDAEPAPSSRKLHKRIIAVALAALVLAGLVAILLVVRASTSKDPPPPQVAEVVDDEEEDEVIELADTTSSGSSPSASAALPSGASSATDGPHVVPKTAGPTPRRVRRHPHVPRTTPHPKPTPPAASTPVARTPGF